LDLLTAYGAGTFPPKPSEQDLTGRSVSNSQRLFLRLVLPRSCHRKPFLGKHLCDSLGASRDMCVCDIRRVREPQMCRSHSRTKAATSGRGSSAPAHWQRARVRADPAGDPRISISQPARSASRAAVTAIAA